MPNFELWQSCRKWAISTPNPTHTPFFDKKQLTPQLKTKQTPQSSVILMTSAATQLVKAIPAHYETQMPIATFTRTRHWYLLWIKRTIPHPLPLPPLFL
jgi:hypothetical protein